MREELPGESRLHVHVTSTSQLLFFYLLHNVPVTEQRLPELSQADSLVGALVQVQPVSEGVPQQEQSPDAPTHTLRRATLPLRVVRQSLQMQERPGQALPGTDIVKNERRSEIQQYYRFY